MLGKQGNVTENAPRARETPPAQWLCMAQLIPAHVLSSSRALGVLPRAKPKCVTEILPLGNSAGWFLALFHEDFFLQGYKSPQAEVVAAQAGAVPQCGGTLWSLPCPGSTKNSHIWQSQECSRALVPAAIKKGRRKGKSQLRVIGFSKLNYLPIKAGLVFR